MLKIHNKLVSLNAENSDTIIDIYLNNRRQN